MHLNSNDDKGINGQSEQLLFFKLELLGAVVDLAVETANEHYGRSWLYGV